MQHHLLKDCYMIKKYIIAIGLLVIILIPVSSKAQNYLDYLIDRNIQEISDSVALDFCHNMWGDTIGNDCFFTFHITYLTCGPVTNLTFLESGMVDTAMFSKHYFCSGKFLLDHIEKTKYFEGEDKCISFFLEGRPYLYDKCNNKCYVFRMNEWIDRNNHANPIKLKDYIYECNKFEQFMGKLLGNGIIDCIFAYPTRFFDVDGEASVSTLPDVLFGIKDNEFYVLYENWKEKNQYTPLLFNMDEFIDCYWGKLSDIKLK